MVAPEVVYLACALMSLLVAFLLIRKYKDRRNRLLLWASLCFVALAFNNVLLYVDLVLLPNAISLAVVRQLFSLAAVSILIYGLVWETA